MRESGILEPLGERLEAQSMRQGRKGAARSSSKDGLKWFPAGRLHITHEGRLQPLDSAGIRQQQEIEQQVSATGSKSPGASQAPLHSSQAEWVELDRLLPWYARHQFEMHEQEVATGVLGAMLGMSMSVARAFRGKARTARIVTATSLRDMDADSEAHPDSSMQEPMQAATGGGRPASDVEPGSEAAASASGAIAPL